MLRNTPWSELSLGCNRPRTALHAQMHRCADAPLRKHRCRSPRCPPGQLSRERGRERKVVDHTPYHKHGTPGPGPRSSMALHVLTTRSGDDLGEHPCSGLGPELAVPRLMLGARGAGVGIAGSFGKTPSRHSALGHTASLRRVVVGCVSVPGVLYRRGRARLAPSLERGRSDFLREVGAQGGDVDEHRCFGFKLW